MTTFRARISLANIASLMLILIFHIDFFLDHFILLLFLFVVAFLCRSTYGGRYDLQKKKTKNTQIYFSATEVLSVKEST